MKPARVLIGGLSLLLVTGCVSHHARTYVTPEGQVVSIPPGRNASDVALETEIRAELNRYGDLATVSPNVGVQANEGTVTLTGPVPNERDRQMIDTLVRNSNGVVAVNDQMQVTYPPTGVVPSTTIPAPVVGTPAPVVTTGPTPVPATAPGFQVQAPTDADRHLADKVVHRLAWDSVPSTALQDVTVTVNNGDVYLNGVVADQEQHRQIISSVQHVVGVRTIYDHLQVR